MIIVCINLLMIRFDEYASLYHQELTKEIIPFWENHSIDK